MWVPLPSNRSPQFSVEFIPDRGRPGFRGGVIPGHPLDLPTVPDLLHHRKAPAPGGNGAYHTHLQTETQRLGCAGRPPPPCPRVGGSHLALGKTEIHGHRPFWGDAEVAGQPPSQSTLEIAGEAVGRGSHANGRGASDPRSETMSLWISAPAIFLGVPCSTVPLLAWCFCDPAPH